MDANVTKTLYGSRWSEEQQKRFERLSPDEAMREIHAVLAWQFPGCDDRVVDLAYRSARSSLRNRARGRTERTPLRHDLAVAWTMVRLGFDPTVAAAALLHDAGIEANPPGEEWRQQFGPRLTRLVEACSELDLETGENALGKGETILLRVQEVLRRCPEELPALIIKFAERLDEICFLAPHLPRAQRARFARETLDGYAPAAGRLGIWELKAQLQDGAFRLLYPEDHARVAGLLERQREHIALFLNETLPALRLAVRKVSGDAVVDARVGHTFSCWEKMQNKGRAFSQLHDLLGARVRVRTTHECYAVLAMAARLWTPIPSEFDDYIARPKPNGYRSLHATMISEYGFPFEIQIRTEEMHQIAEYGSLAHWRYKRCGDAGDGARNALVSSVQRQVERIRRLRVVDDQISAWRKDLGACQVQVYGPDRQWVSSPAGVTGSDLAHAGHSAFENRFRVVRAGRCAVAAHRRLETGDAVRACASS